jgi:hypothetical protein
MAASSPLSSTARPAGARDTGGIPHTADAGLDDAVADKDRVPGQPPAKEDGPLESLGKAITDPLRTAADDDEADTR